MREKGLRFGLLVIFLAVMGAVGLGVERSLAYVVGSISSNPPARTVTYGNWDATSFDLTAPVTAAAPNSVAWGVTGLPQNTTALFSDEAVKEGVASATLIVTQAAGTSGPDVGSYTITVTAEGENKASTNVTLTINQRPVKILGSFGVVSKPYDGTTTATIATNSLSLEQEQLDPDGNLDRGFIARDELSLAAVAQFVSKDAGSPVANLLSSSLSGSDANNYILDFGSAPTTSGVIDPKDLTLSGLTFSKVYNGTTAITASGTPAVASGVVEGEATPTISGSPVWVLDDPNVGTSKTVSISSGSYTSSDPNYRVSTTTFSTAIVTKATLTVNFTVMSRAYNGTMDVTPLVSAFTYSGLATRDSGVTASFSSATAASKDFGTHAVTLSGLTLSTQEARDNYTVQAQSGRTIVISKKALTLEGSFSANSRPYDGTRTATGNVSGLRLAGVVNTEDVTLGAVTLQFASAHQGANIVVSVSGFSLSGTATSNYSTNVSGAPTTTATISPFVLSITPTPNPKTYDGTRTASVSCTANTFADGLGVQASCSSATFDGDGRVVLSGGVAQAQSITVGTVTLTNNSLGNYDLPAAAVTTTQVIQPKELTISGLSGVGRVYDGTNAVSVTGTPELVGVVSPDDVNLTPSSPVFQLGTKDAGINKPIIASGYALGGVHASNYSLSQPASLTATITALPVTVTVNHAGGGKTYDSTTNVTLANVSLTVVGVIGSDSVSAAFESAIFDQKNAGIRTLTVDGVQLSGDDAANYSTGTSASNATVEIFKKSLTIGEPHFTYNGTTDGLATFDLSGVVTVCDEFRENCRTDSISFSVSGSFSEKEKYVHSGSFTWSDAITIGGADKDNYEYTLPNSGVTGSIRPRTLGIEGLTAAAGKVYDASTSAASVISGSPTLTNPSGVTGTIPTLTGTPVYTYDSQFVGEDILITTTGLSLNGADIDGDGVAEFTLFAPSWNRNITPATLTIGGTFEANDRPYDRGTVATVKTNSLNLVGVQGSPADGVTLNTPILKFDTPSAGADKTVSITNATTLAGDDVNGDGLAEYVLSFDNAPTYRTAEVFTVNLDSTLRVTVSNKTYDGTTSATISSATVTPLSGDEVTVAPGRTAEFVTRDQGSSKSVNLSNLSLTGTHAGNYTISATRSNFETTATISRATLTITGITSPGKVYDRTNSAPKRVLDGPECLQDQGSTCVVDDLSAKLSGVMSPADVEDDVTLVKTNGAFTFNFLSQGSARTLNGSGYTLDGTDSANYTLTQPTLSSIPIARKPLTAGAVATTRVYDGTPNASTITSLSLPGVIGEDTVTVGASAITFDGDGGRNVGSGKAITASGLSLSGSSSDNYELTSTTATATGAITEFTLTLSPSATPKVYDGDNTAAASCTINRFIIASVADDVAADCSNATFPSKDVARNDKGVAILQTVSITGITLSGSAASNYLLPSTTTSTTAKITPKPLLASGFTPFDKVYDGNRTARFNITAAALTGFVGSDSFSFSEVGGLFATADVVYLNGEVAQQNVRLNSWTFTGDDEVTKNYDIDIDNSTTRAKITPKPLPVTVTTSSKVYNGTTAATLVATFVNTDLIATDRTTPASVTASATGVFVDENVANGKTVTIQTATLGGSRSFNYAIQAPATTTGNITPRTLNWTVVASHKEYDGSDSATVTVNDDRIVGDVFDTKTFTSAVFSNANVGTGKTVTVSGISISGGDAGNYVYATSRTGTANITARQITVTGTFAAEPKTYDRSPSATVTGTTGLILGNVVETDRASLTISATAASFDNITVGTGKTVTLDSLTLSGVASGNYTVNVSGVDPYLLGVITARALIPTVTIDDRLWDGTTNATILSATVSPIADDAVSVDRSAAVATFIDADQGNAKRVDVTGLALTGAQAGNYTMLSTAVASASITGTPITISVTADDKTYDGTRVATFTFGALSLTDGSHDVTIDYTSALFAQSNWGTSITVSVSGLRLGGADANRYALTSTTASDTADIDKKTLTIEANGKVYDAETTATIAASGAVAGEQVTVTFASALFSDKNVGQDKTVTLSNPGLSGPDSANYSLPNPLTLEADITPRSLAVSFTPNPAVSDPASPVTVDPEDDRISGDAIALLYTDASAIRRGNQLVLVVTGISLSGPDANNYLVTTPFERVLLTYASVGGSSAQPPAVTQPTLTDPRPRLGPPSQTTPMVPRNSLSNPVTPTTTPTPTLVAEPTPPSLPGLSSLGALPGNGGASSENLGSPFNGQATIDLGLPAQNNAAAPQNPQEPVIDSNSAGRRTVSELAQERLGGFQPAAKTFVEILGARTAARFVVSDTSQIDQLTLIRAIEASVPAHAADFFTIESVQPANQPLVPGAWTPEKRAGVAEFFAGAGLPEPRTLADLSLDDYSQWLLVTATSSTYAPGTQVYLTLTSEPLVLASSVVGQDGTATLSGTIPVEFLSAGEHRIRLVGIRALDGVSVDDQGEVQVSPELLEEIERFDLGTQATIAVIGPNNQGANHVALRVIPLIPQAPWWTLWLILGGALFAMTVRLVPGRRTRMRRITNMVVGVVAMLPAVIFGWLSTVTTVVWWGLGLGLGAVVLSVLGPYRTAHTKEPAGPRHS